MGFGKRLGERGRYLVGFLHGLGFDWIGADLLSVGWVLQGCDWCWILENMLEFGSLY